MKFKTTNRQFLSAALIVFYLIPLLLFGLYSIGLVSQDKRWSFLSLGLLTIAICTLILMLILYYWEQAVRNRPAATLIPLQQPFYPPPEKEAKVTHLDPALTFGQSPPRPASHLDSPETTQDLNLVQTSLSEEQKQIEHLSRSLDLKNQELQKLEEENKQLQLEVLQVTQDFSDYKLFSEEQLKQKHYQWINMQQIVEDQRSEMEKRQEQIYQLDTKIHDLSYEIKTLLYLNEEETASQKSPGAGRSSVALKTEEIPSPYYPGNVAEKLELTSTVIESGRDEGYDQFENPINTAAEASQLLKKCVNDAQKLTGANYYSNESSRYREFSSSYFAIDQRRLFDSLRNETSALIVVYSQKELKVVFVNNRSRNVLGWSPEKFVEDFSTIMQEGMNDWKKAVSQLGTAAESQTRLLAKTKQGQEIILNCHLGVIPTGLFRNYVIGVLY